MNASVGPTPLSWQPRAIETIRRAITKDRSVLDASDTGVGKTFQTLFALQHLNRPFGVITPKSVIPAWLEACELFGIAPLFVENVEKLKARKAYLKRDEGKRWKWQVPEGTILIFDEVHMFSGHDTQNGHILRAAPSPSVMLSATAADSPVRFRGIGHKLGLFSWSQWWMWCQKHGCTKGKFGGLEFTGGDEHLAAIRDQLARNGQLVRTKIADLGDRFPENVVRTISVPVTGQKAIDEAYREELELLRMESESPLAELTRLRQIVEHEKLPATMELVRNTIAEGSQCAVFVNYRDSLDRFTDQFEGVTTIHGGQNDSERAAEIARFQSGSASLIVSMIQAGGVGVSLHDKEHQRTRHSFILPGFSARELKQALGRLPRAGGGKAIQNMVFAEGTIDSRIRAKVNKKLHRIEMLTDVDLTAL